MQKVVKGMSKPMVIFFILIAVIAIGLGLSDSVLANYFKDAYNVDSATRGFIEFPRELPGIIGMFIIAALSMLGDLRISLIAQGLSIIGLLALGLFTPPFAIMLVFLFINSMGMHLFMPLADGIGLSIIEDKKAVGRRMGQYSAVRTACGMVAGLLVFVGFRTGFFSFKTQIKWIFLLAAAMFLIGLGLLITLQRSIGKKKVVPQKMRLLFRKEYTSYYILAMMNGAQKQIMYVYAPWVLIELLSKGADTMSLLSVVGSFIGIFFLPIVGRCIDRFGVKKMLLADALSFIIIYLLYGFFSGGIHSGYFPVAGWAGAVVIGIFILDKMSMQMGMIRTVYLNSIALDQSEVTRTLSTGVALDHVVSITCAFLGGLTWLYWGPQYVFYTAAILSLVNLIVALRMKEQSKIQKQEVSV